MNVKEIKKIAKKIVEQELIIQNTADPHERRQAQNEIMRITNSVRNEEDLFIIDEYIQEFLSEKN